MKKTLRLAILLLAVSALATLCALASEIKMYDFKTSSLGWTVSNASDITYDGEHINFGTPSTNSILQHDFASEKVFGGDYPYIVCRAKVDNKVNTDSASIKIYVKTLDEDGNVIDGLWDGVTASPSQLMKFSDDGKYVTYVTDMTNVGHYMTSYLGSFVYGVGLYIKGIDVSVDYLALVPADKMNVNITFESNTTDEVTGMPKDTTAVFGSDINTTLYANPRREGYLFSGWSDTASGAVKDVCNVKSDATLYAIWREDDTVKITYLPNAFGETVTGLPTERTISYEFGSAVSLPTGLSRTGKSFVGWSSTPDGKNMVSDGFEAKSDLTLYAVWGQARLIWDFNADGKNEGWGAANCTTAVVKDGLYSCVPSNYDPQLYSPALNVDTSVYTKLAVTMSLTLPSTVNSTLMQVFVSVDGSNYAESTCVKRTIPASGLVTYVLDMTQSSIWKGGICTKIRLDASSSTGSTFAIDKIEFISDSDCAVFEANKGTGKQSSLAAQDGYVTLPECAFSRDGFAFDGWTTDGVTVYKSGEKIAVSGVTSFYALWKSLGGLNAVTEIYYPNYTKKAFIMSYDDGDVSADPKMIGKMNAAGLKGTFNLIGKNYASYTEDQLKNLVKTYEGQEVANHSYNHWNMTASASPFYTADESIEDMEKGRIFLEDTFGYKIRGTAWPFTNPNRQEITDYAKSTYLYTRGAPVLGDGFNIPESFIPAWNFTCIHAYQGVVYCQDYLEDYLGLDSDELTVFSLWGHSFQFNSDNNWDVLDAFISTYVSANQNIWNPFVSDYVEYVNATRSLVKTANYLYNPSDVALYLTVDGKELILPAKSLYDGKKVTSCTYVKTSLGCDYSFTADAETNEVAIAAAYSDDGKLLGAKFITLSAGVAAYNGSIASDEPVSTVKIFLFSDLQNVRPLGSIEVTQDVG